jgi:hypothetical protein
MDDFTKGLHKSGRIFTLICILLICFVPVVYCLSAGVTPRFELVGGSVMFILGYVLIGLIEAVSYAPLLGPGGQYSAFITGNISNLKLPCALNAQNITKVADGSAEHQVVSTLAIAVSSIVTTLIVSIGIIPLIIWGSDVAEVLKPVSPYVIPAIFGGLGLVLIAKYPKQVIIPFVIMLAVGLITLGVGTDLGQSVMLSIGMVVSIVAGLVTYRIGKKKEAAVNTVK